MDGQFEPRLAASVGPEAVEAETSVASRNGVAVSIEQILPGGKQGKPGRGQRGSLQKLVLVLPLILSFASGLLLGAHLPVQQVQLSIPPRLVRFRDSKEQHPSLEASLAPASSAEGEVALGTTQLHDASLSPTLQQPSYDAWGLPFLSHFEQTLSPELRQGKEEIASLLTTSCPSTAEPNEYSQIIEQKAAEALSGGDVKNLVGMAIALSDVEPIKPRGKESTHLPSSVRVTKVLKARYPSIVMEVKDTVSEEMHALRIRVFSAAGIQNAEDEEKLLASAQRWADSEEVIGRQASCGTPAHLAAVQKGLAVPLYVGNVANAPRAILHGGFYFFRRVHILERLHGEFRLGSLITAGLSLRAQEYIALRLLHIVLKLQEALLSHNDLAWDNIYARPDGSFLLGGFDACIPFGRAIGMHIRLSGRYVEPTLRIQEDVYAENAVPQAHSDLWSLGMLLYELFTGGNVPYTEDERDYLEYALPMSKYLIDKEVDPIELVPDLDAANCPVRWKQLIMRLLHPVRGSRITASGIMMEFPDLVDHRLPR